MPGLAITEKNIAKRNVITVIQKFFMVTWLCHRNILSVWKRANSRPAKAKNTMAKFENLFLLGLLALLFSFLLQMRWHHFSGVVKFEKDEFSVVLIAKMQVKVVFLE